MALSLELLLLMLAPMYVANSSALVFGGKTPLDRRRRWSDGRRILGDGKTLRGTVLGTLWGVLTTCVLIAFFPFWTQLFFPGNYLYYGILVSMGAIGGDLLGSFIKRRLGFSRGESAIGLDQLDFVVGGLTLASLAYFPPLDVFAVAIVITPFVHFLANNLAYWLKLKTVPW